MASIATRTDSKGRKSYQVKWRQDGRQRSRTLRRRSDAEILRARVEIGEQAPPPRKETAAAVTVGEVHELFRAARRVSRARLATEASLAKRLAPIANVPVSELAPSRIRAWVSAMVDEGLAAETVQAVLRLLRMVLDTAVEDGHVIANAAARVKAPRAMRPPLDHDDVISLPDIARLLEEVQPRWRALVGTLVYLGCRWSEALALTPADVDLLRGRVHVGHRVVEEVAGQCRVRSGGKTRSSDRWVPLPSPARRLLSEAIQHHDGGRDDLLFVTSEGTSPLRGNFRRQVWLPACERAEIQGVTVRNLRHSAASMMLASGMRDLEVAARLGHSKPSITKDVYARFIPSAADVEDPYEAMLRAHSDQDHGNTTGTGISEKGSQAQAPAG